MGAPQRNPRQSPRFRVNQAVDLDACIRRVPNLAAVVEGVGEYVPAMK